MTITATDLKFNISIVQMDSIRTDGGPVTRKVEPVEESDNDNECCAVSDVTGLYHLSIQTFIEAVNDSCDCL